MLWIVFGFLQMSSFSVGCRILNFGRYKVREGEGGWEKDGNVLFVFFFMFLCECKCGEREREEAKGKRDVCIKKDGESEIEGEI